MQFFVGYLGLVVNGTPALASEASGAGYARQAVAFSAPGDGALSMALSQSYSFGVATVDWGQVTGVALYEDTLAGSLPVLKWGTTPRYVTAGTTFSVPASALALLIQAKGVSVSGEIVGQTIGGADILAGQTVSILDGVLTPAPVSGGSEGTLSQLYAQLSSLMQALPQSDPGDGVSLWSNGNLLSLSIKSQT